ncbi:hypothetical protein E2C01_076347 [Portunus trituberculatus]|uniref:Uncharacterized protein n=1 Tax=Portunus trituberculatus TaxID=210409 RepID=A0A5B7IIB4_PORTR|nr:hypothetical protein [Portunus trituberculatus]
MPATSDERLSVVGEEVLLSANCHCASFFMSSGSGLLACGRGGITGGGGSRAFAVSPPCSHLVYLGKVGRRKWLAGRSKLRTREEEEEEEGEETEEKEDEEEKEEEEEEEEITSYAK